MPVSPDRQRKLNNQYGHKLNIFLDSLFDYPTIIQAKLKAKGSWELFNRLLTVQVGGCDFRCWYCYCDDSLLNGNNLLYVNPKDLIDKFLEQRTADSVQGVQSNVLRISGGEPFLAVELILGCLEELRRRRLDEKIFVWTETNLSPFLTAPKETKSLLEKWGVNLQRFAEFKNFAVHPCIHGTSPANLKEVTKLDEKWFDGLLKGFKCLIDNKIDVYPTISPNMSSPDDVSSIFGKLRSINEYLPLRVALIEYHLDYPTVFKRKGTELHTTVYNKYLFINRWNDLLLKNYQLSYAEKPRHEVPLW